MAAVNSQYNASSGADDVPVKPVAFTGSNGKIPTLVDYNAFASSGTTLAIANKPPSLGDRKIQLPNIPVDIDWNLTSNQGATLCIKNKPNLAVTPTSFFDVPDNPFQQIGPSINGAKTGVLLCDGVTTNNALTSFNQATFFGAIRVDGGISKFTNNNTGFARIFADVAGTGSYSDLVNKPTFATVATTGNYSDLSNRPALATVATSGSYNDLSNKPVAAPAYFAGYVNLTTNTSITLYYNANTFQFTSPTITLALDSPTVIAGGYWTVWVSNVLFDRFTINANFYNVTGTGTNLSTNSSNKTNVQYTVIANNPASAIPN